MSLEWFDRVCSEMQDYMESVCEEYDEIGHITVDRAAKHPRIEFFIEDEEGERDYFCTLFFDPSNEEFYVEEFDVDLQQTSRLILSDIEDIIQTIHETFHDFLNTEMVEDDEVEIEMIDEDETEEDMEDIDVEWTTSEVLAYTYKDEVEVAYQFGVVPDTGDGVLRRVNRVVTYDDELLEDETNFIFSKEEAGTIMALIESNMDAMDVFDPAHEMIE